MHATVPQPNHGIPGGKLLLIYFSLARQGGEGVVSRYRDYLTATFEELLGFTYGVFNEYLQGVQYPILLKRGQQESLRKALFHHTR